MGLLDFAPLVMGNLVMATFYFVGGLVLLEKDEGTLQAQVVTPLRASEYLAAKLTALTLLSLAENLMIVTLVMGFHYRLLPLFVGIAAAAVIYVLTGFVAVARYDSVNEYLMPSMFFVLGLCLPYLDYFEISAQLGHAAASTAGTDAGDESRLSTGGFPATGCRHDFA